MDDIDYWTDDMLDNSHWGVDFSGYNLSDEMIRDSVERTCDFFHIEEPAIIGESYTTGVYVNATDRLDDDVLVFSRVQLAEMGITSQDAFDLVMTHEGTHRMLQTMQLGFDPHQEELCCDFIAGVRAGLNDVDLTQMENSLADTVASATHPAGNLRVHAIEQGKEFARDYMETYGEAPTFDECLEYFSENQPITSALKDEMTLRMEDSEEWTEGLHPFEDDSVYAPSFQGHHIETEELEQKEGERDATEDLNLMSSNESFSTNESEQVDMGVDPELGAESHAALNEQHNVSFKGETITVHQEGNSSRKITLDVEKVPGTSHTWYVKKGGKIIATIKSLINGRFQVPGFGTGVISTH